MGHSGNAHGQQLCGAVPDWPQVGAEVVVVLGEPTPGTWALWYPWWGEQWRDCLALGLSLVPVQEWCVLGTAGHPEELGLVSPC